jgi:multicomponent Na+:H+ antiporter subunit G
MDAMTVVILVLIVLSGFFSLLGVIGLMRFPDVYTRLHAATKGTTFGIIFMVLAVMVYGVVRYLEVESYNQASFIVLVVHAFLALLAVLLTNPVGAHAIARAARRTGITPEMAVIDEFEEVK